MALIVTKSVTGWDIFKKGPDGPEGESLGHFSIETEAHKKCYEMDEMYVYVPWGITTLADAFEAESAKDNAKHISHVVEMYKRIIDNIIDSSEVSNKGAAIKKLANELAGMIDEIQEKGDEHEEKSITTTSSPVEVEADLSDFFGQIF